MGDQVPILLLGNKLDNEKEREVPRGLGEQLAKVSTRIATSQTVRHKPKGLGGSFWKSLQKDARWVSWHCGNRLAFMHGEFSIERHISPEGVGWGPLGMGKYPKSHPWNVES